MAPLTLDTMFAMDRAPALLRPRIMLMLTIMDYAHACKHIGVGVKTTQFAAIAPSDPHGGGMPGLPERPALLV